MPKPGSSRNPFFQLAAFSSVMFIVTILAMVAGVFGDERAPIAQFLDRYIGRVLAAEVAAILLTGFLALFIDRRQTLRCQVGAGNEKETDGTRSVPARLAKESPQATHDSQHSG
jgi:hypothetical protein